MSILLFFVDGIGLGEDDASNNPFRVAQLPTLQELSGCRPWLAGRGPWRSEWSAMFATDACLGVPGRPQSASGQATLLTGINAPQQLGEHYGPRPDGRLREMLGRDNLFQRVLASARRATTLEAYPPPFHAAIARGKRLPASIQYAALAAGLKLRDAEDLRRGAAIPGDFTGQGWRTHFDPNFAPFPAREAGVRLAQLARGYDFSVFSYWLTDVIGHRGDLAAAVAQLELLDAVLAGLLAAWDTTRDTFILTSDHGNLEAMDHGKHTRNDIPTLVVGPGRAAFAELLSLADIAPAIERILGITPAIAG